jgi:AcrR family transcriptional regulator
VAPESGLRESKKEQTRLAIARAALRLFLDQGFENTSITDIAKAAQVSKMTVFNYFPAKEEMFFFFIRGVMPDFGQVVRDRPAGQAPVDALHAFYRAELGRRAEWTGLHDGVTRFSRMAMASPTLMAGFTRHWQEHERDLLLALGTDAGLDPEEEGLTESLEEFYLRLGRPGEPGRSRPPGTGAVRVRLAATQILAALRLLVLANQTRQALEMTADEAEPLALAEADAAFGFLREGLNPGHVSDTTP